MSERDRLHDLTYLTAVLCFIGFISQGLQEPAIIAAVQG